MYALGYDIGSSSVKTGLVDLSTGHTLTVLQSPLKEMEILSPKADWAEQDPETWWYHVCQSTQNILKETGISSNEIQSIGISYQMHGLVMLDKLLQPLRPAIIWCDSRAVPIGNQAYHKIGATRCLNNILNSPGNFTASKLAWVKQNEPEKYGKIHLVMLPGDYIAMRLTGEARTTVQGMSEGMFWDFKSHKLADFVLGEYGISKSLFPPIQDAISMQGKVSSQAAAHTGLAKGTPVTYRAGDQPNNAMSLNVLQPGEIAATGGTSGVVFGVGDKLIADKGLRVKSFAHVNNTSHSPRIGILLCINGAGSAYRFVRQLVDQNQSSYHDMEEQADKIPIGSEGLVVYPFGNGAERMLLNQNPGAKFENIHFNMHGKAHFFRAVLEGIAYSFMYGMRVMQSMELELNLMKVGNDNLFQSQIFSQTLANLVACDIQLIKTTGAVGAAKASAVATGYYQSLEEAMSNQEIEKTYSPDKTQQQHLEFYHNWAQHLNR